MKKKLMIFTIIFIMLVILLFPNNVKAASASISASNKSISVGETTTINVNITSTEAWNLNISSSGGNLSKTSDADAYGEEKTTTAMSATFSANQPGTYKISLTGTVAGSDLIKKEVTGSVTITVNPKPTTSSGSNAETPNKNNVPTETNQNTKTETTKSSNNYLSRITLSTGTLSPEFYRETYEYSVEFGEDVNLYELSEIEVSAQAEDSRASIEGVGKVTLNDGENSIAINVTAENGSVRTYTVKVNKPAKVEQSELRLKTLVLNGINTDGEYQTIDFSLDPEIFEYNLTVPNNISSISITPTTENKDIIIETNGGDNLKEGENKIVIILTSPSDETIKTTYTLNVERQSGIVEAQGLTKEQIGLIIIGGVIILTILIIVIVLIVKHRKKKNPDDNDDDESDINFINDKENIEDEEIENPYPEKIKIRDSDDTDSEEIKSKNNADTEDKDKLNTVEDIKPAKLKWDDFIEADEEDDEDDDDEKSKKKTKQGKRFM